VDIDHADREWSSSEKIPAQRTGNRGKKKNNKEDKLKKRAREGLKRPHRNFPANNTKQRPTRRESRCEEISSNKCGAAPAPALKGRYVLFQKPSGQKVA